MSDLLAVVVVLLALPAIYVLAYAASRAYFSAKMHYNRELFSSLERRSLDSGEESEEE